LIIINFKIIGYENIGEHSSRGNFERAYKEILFVLYPIDPADLISALILITI